MPEQRKSNRARTLLGARAVFNGGLTTLDCHVRDISEFGAKLTIDSHAYIPDEFVLEIPRKGQSMKAVVRRREPGFVGVEFQSQPQTAPEGDLGARVKQLEAENAALRRRMADMARRLDSYGDSERSPI